MIIHLNEDIFHRLFLTEATVEDIYQKYYSDIPYGTFIQILQLDPTYRDGRMGKYGKWLLNIYRKGTFKEGDFGEAKRLLPIYDKYKNVIKTKDIMSLSSMGELYQVVQPYIGGNMATSKSDAARKIKEDAEKVYEDNQWVIVVPHTKEAAILYGKNTKWCTAAEDEQHNMFNYYNDSGPLYINIRKSDGKKFQFHFNSYPKQFMDELDEPILKNDDEHSIAEIIGLSPGAVEFYKEKYTRFKDICLIIYGYNKALEVGMNEFNSGNRKGYELFDEFRPNENSHWWLVKVDDKYNFVNMYSYKSLSKEWFRQAGDFKNGYAIVGRYKENKNLPLWTYIDESGALCDKWFDSCRPINEHGLGVVSVEKDYNGRVQWACNIIIAGSWDFLFKEPLSSIQGGELPEEGYFFAETEDREVVFLTLSGKRISKEELGRKFIDFIEHNDMALQTIYEYESGNQTGKKESAEPVLYDYFVERFLEEEPCWQMEDVVKQAYNEWMWYARDQIMPDEEDDY